MSELEIGDYVYHPKFGEGIIVGFEKGDAVKVYFRSLESCRTIIYDFILRNLDKVSDAHDCYYKNSDIIDTKTGSILFHVETKFERINRIMKDSQCAKELKD